MEILLLYIACCLLFMLIGFSLNRSAGIDWNADCKMILVLSFIPVINILYAITAICAQCHNLGLFDVLTKEK